jgi:phage baseplate assembly protein gpV
VHRFETGTGYVTEFATLPPERPVRACGPVVTVGTVLAIDDPDGLGRCRVKLGGFGDAETGWLQVLVPGAGAAKGLAALPDPEDAVLVLFPEGDPARGFVLGGLYGEKRLPRGLGVKAARPFVLRTAGGQGLELGASAALARLSTKSGSLLELLPSRARLAAATDLVIEAPGRTITIRADAIKLERG